MLIDITRLVLRRLQRRLPTGVDRVALAYVERYGLGLHRAEASAHGPTEHAAQALLRLGRRHGVARPDASQRLFRWLLDTGGSRPPWASLATALAAGVPAGADLAGRWVVHPAHSGLELAHWARPLRAAGARPLTVIHDLIPITHPQFCRAGEAERHERRMRHALQWSAAVVVNSAATLEALADWADGVRLALPPVTVSHLGPGSTPSAASTAAASPLDVPYFVCLGTVEPRKNHLLLLNVWERLLRRHGPVATPRLVLIGQRGWEIDHVLRHLDRTPGLRDVVVERPHCDDASLQAWLRHARALLFPSSIEGYGMPLVEALDRGLPVIASDLPVFREIAGDVPDYRDPLDTLGWLAAVEAYAQPVAPSREGQLRRLRDYRAPDWIRHFERVDALMARASRPARPVWPSPFREAVRRRPETVEEAMGS